ncbi:hypothetical protein M3J09_003882 [Ascochyta lentis]
MARDGPSCLDSTVSAVMGERTAILTSVPTIRVASTSHLWSAPVSAPSFALTKVTVVSMPHTISVTGPYFTLTRQSSAKNLPMSVENLPLLRSLAGIRHGSRVLSRI